jgi:hypothetical protein
LQHYLRGHKFTLLTDHRNLQWMRKSPVPKVQRWSLALQEYEYDIQWIEGKKNVLADAFSRLPVTQEKEAELRKDALLQQPIHAVTAADEEADGEGEGDDTSCAGFDIGLVHNEIAGHHGITKTVMLLREAGQVWSGMVEDVARYIHSCPQCQREKSNQGDLTGKISSSLSSYEPFYSVSVDKLGDFVADKKGNTSIIVFICDFTRYTELVAAPDGTAASAAKAMLQVFARYGAPAMLRSDGGGQFVAEIINEFAKLLTVSKVVTIPHRPQSNGLVERVNAEIVKHLKALVVADRAQADWSDWLPLVQRIINSTPNRAIGCAPAKLVYASDINLNRGFLFDVEEEDLGKGGSKPNNLITHQYLKDLTTKQQTLQRRAIAYLEKEVEGRQGIQESPVYVLAPGTYVLVCHPRLGLGKGPTKLSPRWMGPRQVVSRHGNAYTVKNLVTGGTNVYDISRLKIFDDTRCENVLDEAAKEMGEWVVQAIVDHRGTNTRAKRGQMQFLVEWVGYPGEDSWLPYAEVKDLEALALYARRTTGLGNLVA